MGQRGVVALLWWNSAHSEVSLGQHLVTQLYYLCRGTSGFVLMDALIHKTGSDVHICIEVFCLELVAGILYQWINSIYPLV